MLTGNLREARMRVLQGRIAASPAATRIQNRIERSAFAESLREWQLLRQSRAQERAAALGIPVRGIAANGRTFELVDIVNDRPLYHVTTNQDAAISTAADLVRNSVPYSVDGTSVTLGIWDSAQVRTTHQEFQGRVIASGDTFTLSDHGTHVAGTMVASGVMPRAEGMAPGATLVSYDWNSDWSEMAAIGATYPGEPGSISISNHSYSYRGGWAYIGDPSYQWLWYGLFTSGNQAASVEDNFGRYDSNTASLDNVASGAPYYLPFVSAGNERNDVPAAGDTWKTSASSTTIRNFNAASDPLGDGQYKSGYDNLMMMAIAKNVMTVGAVTDADDDVPNPGGNRLVSAASLAGFTSWGPADDGRIKPDIVANGVSLYSSLATSDSAYTDTYSGTSMSSPNAAGSAALLVDLFTTRFPNSAMRASTLKALIIHTADDLGTAGPDYQSGWGLMNTLAAAQLIDAHAVSSGEQRMIEGTLSSSKPSEVFSFVWDGVSPIRVTLAWTDPTGAAKSGHDNRARDLVNDLNLLVTDPGSTQHKPFVMPHVGSWTNASLSSAATTGINTVDNIEQVLIPTPGLAGTYSISIAASGGLAGGTQAYSVIVSGAGIATPAAAPVVTSFTAPSGCPGGDIMASVVGTGFQLGGNLFLTRAGYPNFPGSSPMVFTDQAQSQLEIGLVMPGIWNLSMINPDGQAAVVPGAVEVPISLLDEDFENLQPGWTTVSTDDGSDWGLTTDLSASPVTSAAVPGSIPQSESSLFAPQVSFPIGGTCYRLTFQHWYSLQYRRDGAVLEVSFDNGSTWADITAAGGTFLQGAYNNTLNTSTNPIGPNNHSIWTSSSGGFETVEVALDPATYAGADVIFRWRLGCNSGTQSTGWVVDDVALRVDVSDTWTAFEYWRHNNTGDAFTSESANDDGDGLDLFGEYAFAGDHANPDTQPATVGEDSGYLTITFPIRLEATDVTFTVKTGTAPDSMVSAAVYTSNGAEVVRNGATNTVQVSVVYNGAKAIVTERSAIAIEDETSRFLKVEAVRPAP